VNGALLELQFPVATSPKPTPRLCWPFALGLRSGCDPRLLASQSHVLDAFAGSGTTLIATERTGRRAYGIEIDPAYCDVIIQRIRRVCGPSATLQATTIFP